MNANLSPDDRTRIAEEQRIRDKETMKFGFKTLGKMYLIIGGIALVIFCCSCLCLTVFFVTTYGSLINGYGY